MRIQRVKGENKVWSREGVIILTGGTPLKTLKKGRIKNHYENAFNKKINKVALKELENRVVVWGGVAKGK